MRGRRARSGSGGRTAGQYRVEPLRERFCVVVIARQKSRINAYGLCFFPLGLLTVRFDYDIRSIAGKDRRMKWWRVSVGSPQHRYTLPILCARKTALQELDVDVEHNIPSFLDAWRRSEHDLIAATSR